MAANFKEALEEQLLKSGFSAYRLGQLAGVSKQTMSVLLAGESKPWWETVVRIAKR